ncbi:hypothetical protein DRN86_05660, partial [Candidatus Geothermarchaeota archaeon]
FYETKTVYLGFQVDVDTPFKPEISLDVSPKELIPDKINVIKVFVRNKGTIAANELKVKLSVTGQAALLNGTEYEIDELAPNDSISYQLMIFVPYSLRGGSLLLSSTVSYSFGESLEVEAKQVHFRIKEEIEVKNRSETAFKISSVKWIKNGLETVADPGDILALHVEVVSQLKERISNVYVRIHPPEGIRTEKRTFIYPGVLSPGSMFSAVFDGIELDEDLNLGSYSLKIEIGYGILYYPLLEGSIEPSVIIKENYSEIHEITISIVGRPNIKVLANESKLVPGLNTIEVTVINDGHGTARDIDISLSPTAQVSIIGDQKFEIHELKPGDSNILKVSLYVPSILEGAAFSLPLNVKYEDQDGNGYSDVYNLGFEISTLVKPDVFLEVKPKTLVVGYGEIRVKLRAVNDAIRNLRLTYYSTDMAIIGFQEISLGDLEKGQEKSFNVSVFIPIVGKAGSVMKLNFNVEYDGPRGGHYLKSQTATLIAKGQADLVMLDLSIYPKAPAPDQTFSVSLTILNIGTDDAKELFAKAIYDEKAFIPMASTSVYVGDVKIGVPSPISFSFRVSPEASPGEYEISVKMTYKDSLGEKYEHFMTVPITITRRIVQEEKTTSFTITGNLLMVIIFVLVSLAISLALILRRLKGHES